MEPARRLGHLQTSRPSGAGQRGRLHRRQHTTTPRGPAAPAARRYLLAGLIACGRCGRRLESAWSNGKPAYRCRHGYTSATSPDAARPKNTYVREEQVVPHLAAIAILSRQHAQAPARARRRTAQMSTPAQTAALIDELRAAGVVLTYDPAQQTLRASDGIAVTIASSR